MAGRVPGLSVTDDTTVVDGVSTGSVKIGATVVVFAPLQEANPIHKIIREANIVRSLLFITCLPSSITPNISKIVVHCGPDTLS